MHALTKLSTLLVACSFLINTSCGHSLPSIWGQAQEGKVSKSKSYHIKSEIQLPESGRSFFAEEWADFDRRFLRLDLIDTQSGLRSTILNQHDSGEIFHYRPFVCSLIEHPSHTMDEELSHKFPKTDSFMLTGIGSLWSTSTNVTMRKVKIVPGERSRRKSTYNEREFTKYSTESTPNYPYKVNFYFRDSGTQARSENLAVIDLESENSRVSNFKVRFRILTVELSPKADPNQDVFQLPEGYGCRRKSLLDQTMSNPIVETLTLIPQSLRLNIVGLSPSGNRQDMDKWRTHSTSVRILSGRINLGKNDSSDYLVIELQEHITTGNGSNSGLRKSKEIWSLGKDGLSGESQSPSHSNRTWLFDIDERTGSCSIVEEGSFIARSGLDLPISGQDCAATGTNGLGLCLNIESIRELLVTKDHHLIKSEPSVISPRLKDFVWEKRMNLFKLKDRYGSVYWSGPISIVRRQSFDNVNDEADRWLMNNQPFHNSLKVFFFTPELDRIVAKTNINVLNKRSLDQAAFHRELNVGSCFKNPLAKLQTELASNVYDEKRHHSTSVDFALNYPVESKFAFKRISRDYYSKSALYGQFIRSLHSITGEELDPLQLADIKLNFVEDLIQVSGRLLHKPKILSFREQSGMRFSNQITNAVILSEFKPDAESCAESCHYFNCGVFSYCRYSKSCKLQMKSIESGDQSNQSLELDSDCGVYRSRERRLNFDPLQMAHQLHHIVSARCQESEPTNCPLTMKVEYRGVNGTESSLDLIPSYLDTDSILFDKSEKLGDQMAEDVKQSKLDEGSTIKPQYIVLRDNSKYKAPNTPNKQFPIQLAQHMSYDDCESLCDETDCSSFSHCQIEKTCIVSTSQDISETSESETVSAESYCFIMVRDQLSQFSKTLQVKRPTNLELSAPKLSGPRECASRCIAQPSSSCKSFYFCPIDGECFVTSDSRHGEKEIEISNEGSTVDCDEYTRSLLHEYDRFYAKSLAKEDRSEEVLLDVGPETCALDCIGKNGNCQAFHVCHDDERRSLICVLALQQENSNYTKIVKTLTDDINCTSFLLSPKSTYRRITSNTSDIIEIFEDSQEERFGNVWHIGLYISCVFVGFVAMMFTKRI